MISLACKNMISICPEMISGDDVQDIQKTFLAHVHTAHALIWGQCSTQYRATCLSALRDRFLKQSAPRAAPHTKPPAPPPHA